MIAPQIEPAALRESAHLIRREGRRSLPALRSPFPFSWHRTQEQVVQDERRAAEGETP